MKKKKIVALLASAVMAVSLFAGCGNQSSTSESTDKDKKVKIGLSTDEGGLNDKSFNQAADTGVKKAQKDLKVDYKAIESKQKEDYESNLEALVNDNADLTFGIGFQMEQAMKNVAGKYADKKFAIVDSDQVKAKNVECITFKEQEGSFLMGIIAGKMTKSNKVGFIGGKDSPLIQRFEAGFAAGVKAVNPQAAKGLIGDNGQKGSMVKYADSFTDTNKGSELAKSLYGSGCDVVYHAAGGVGIGLFGAAKELSKPDKKVWAIGVDMDQAVKVPEYSSVILSSMIKKVDAATYNAVKDVVDGKFQGGKHIQLGLKEDGVDIAPSSNKNTPKDVLDLVKKYKAAIKQEKITVPAKREDLPKFKAVKVK